MALLSYLVFWMDIQIFYGHVVRIHGYYWILPLNAEEAMLISSSIGWLGTVIVVVVVFGCLSLLSPMIIPVLFLYAAGRSVWALIQTA